ncbi:hypothetical protein CYY_009322 [Polysphondylium violaceum]|uniref:Cyclin-like domain-containing protein n=1 Tax=Polysphondylium violaceum TaxID=133409 RepID=A0A8J4UW58_9MYCE|nr:hypothetical protein CYY_009322 [Polysphondylium violaceum]
MTQRSHQQYSSGNKVTKRMEKEKRMKMDPYHSILYPNSCLHNHPFHHLVPPYKLPTTLDIINESLHKVKKIEIKEDQTPLFWSLCHILTELPKIGDKVLMKSGSQFHSNLFISSNSEIPKISVADYLVRLVKFSPCSKECFIMIIVYIDRIISKAGFIINSYNIHRLLITSILVASKYIDDIFYNNEYYSQIGGISRNELNRLEISFLNLLQFDLSCPLHTYLDYYSKLDSFVSQLRQQIKVNKEVMKYKASEKSKSNTITKIIHKENEFPNMNISINSISCSTGDNNTNNNNNSPFTYNNNVIPSHFITHSKNINNSSFINIVNNNNNQSPIINTINNNNNNNTNNTTNTTSTNNSTNNNNNIVVSTRRKSIINQNNPFYTPCKAISS